MNKALPLLVYLIANLVFSMQNAAFAQNELDFSAFADDATLLPRERQFISCIDHRDRSSEGMHALSYLHLRGEGKLAEIDILAGPKEKTELLMASQNHVRTMEASCAVKHLPKEPPGKGGIAVDRVADGVISAGYGHEMVRNAERFMSRDYYRSSNYGFSGLKGSVIKAIMAGYNPSQAGDNIGNLRYLYYLCHAFYTPSECSPAVVRDVINRYNDY